MEELGLDLVKILADIFEIFLGHGLFGEMREKIVPDGADRHEQGEADTYQFEEVEFGIRYRVGRGVRESVARDIGGGRGEWG